MAAYAAEIGRVCRALGGCRPQAGFQPQEIDIGGGFAIPRDPFNAATNYGEPVQYAALSAISRMLSLLGSRPRYAVIVAVARRLPERVLQEDADLLMYYDNAMIRMGVE